MRLGAPVLGMPAGLLGAFASLAGGDADDLRITTRHPDPVASVSTTSGHPSGARLSASPCACTCSPTSYRADHVEERWEAFQEAHREAGVKTHASPVRADLTQEDGQRAVTVLLTRSQRPQGLAIPGDLEVTAWDDIAQAGWIVPSRTTVHQPLEELGSRAGQRLQRRLEGEGAMPGLPSDAEMWDVTGDRDGSSVEPAVERTARVESLAESTTTWIGSRVALRQSCGCRVAFAGPLS